MAMSWRDLLFIHWPVPPSAIRPRVPRQLEIDVREGSAWLGVVPFRMTGVRLRWTPPLPRISAFPELNVRTYVIAEGKPGIWFFSLDAASAAAVAAARRAFHLPYFRARMSCVGKDGSVRYRSERTHRGAPEARFAARYRPVGDARSARPGSLEHFLTERYCLYAQAPDGRVLRGDVHHPPWSLQPGDAEIEENTMARAAGISTPEGPPLLHFARRLDAVAWYPKALERGCAP